MKVFLVKFATSLLILMFIVSGFRKVVTLGKSEGKRFSEKLNNFNLSLSEKIVFLAGIWELISCVIILYGIWYFKNNFLKLGSLMLIFFTILATLIFYVKPFKYLPFLSNLTTTCALFLLPFICVK